MVFRHPRYVIYCIIVLIALGLPGFAQDSPSVDPEKVMGAAIRLKKAAVEREWNDCLLKSGSETRCKKLLEILWEQEKRALSRISHYLNDPTIDKKRLNTEMSSCYNPGGNYSELITCWSLLADRLDAAKEGESLIKK